MQTNRTTSQAWLPELDLYYYKARIYNPDLGRFMQTDPIGTKDQINLYAYVGNDPLNVADPTGLIGSDVVIVTGRYDPFGPGSYSCSVHDCSGLSYDILRNAVRSQNGSGHLHNAIWGTVLKEFMKLLLKQGAKNTAKALPKLGQKSLAEITKRGWTMGSVRKTMQNPFKTGTTTNRTTGNSATAYFRSNNQYVVIDDITGEIVQVSNLNDPKWVVDSIIKLK